MEGSDTKIVDDVKAFDHIEHANTMSEEDRKLALAGYNIELKREFSWFSVISFAFSVTAVLAGITAEFYISLASGGPAGAVWAWFWGSFGCMCIGLSVAELVSAYPTNAGMMYTVKHIAPKEYVPVLSWTIGWINLIGQIACSGSVDFALALQITALASLCSGYTYIPADGHIVGVMMACLLLHGALNSFPTKWLARLTSVYTLFNVGGLLAAIIGLPIACKNKNSASYVFTYFENNSGWSNNGISFCLSLLTVAWTMTDYDASSHICEETRGASIKAPVAIILAVSLTAVLGWLLLIVFVMCMGTDIQGLLNAPSSLPPVLIYENVFGRAGAIAMLILTILVQNAACMVCMQACSRTIYAMARDDMLPLSRVWRKVNSRSETPVYAVWLICFICAILGLLDLASYYAVNAIFAVTSIALDWSYALPVICKVIFAKRTSFQPGPIHFGRFSKYINIAAFVWVMFVSIILCFPENMPVTAKEMNYSSVVFVGGLVLSLAYWLFKKSRGDPFLGPAANKIQAPPEMN